MTYHYQAFGLHIHSEIEFPNLPVSQPEGTPQVLIRVGQLPQQLPGAPSTRRYFQASQGKLLVLVKDLGRFLVEDGQRITFETSGGFDQANLRLALINLGLSVILHQRGALALHASAVATPNGAVLFCGERRAGKSTLAAGLHHRGWPLVCDDKAALYMDDGQITVVPSFPELRLWRDAIEHLGIKAERAEKTPDTEKYNLGLQYGFHSTPLPLRAIYLLKPAVADEINLRQLNGMEKFQTIKQHTYINQFLKDLGLLPAHFSLASAIATQISIYEVTRPIHQNRLKALVARMDSELRNS